MHALSFLFIFVCIANCYVFANCIKAYPLNSTENFSAMLMFAISATLGTLSFIATLIALSQLGATS